MFPGKNIGDQSTGSLSHGRLLRDHGAAPGPRSLLIVLGSHTPIVDQTTDLSSRWRLKWLVYETCAKPCLVRSCIRLLYVFNAQSRKSH
jgi:hypothetical protein